MLEPTSEEFKIIWEECIKLDGEDESICEDCYSEGCIECGIFQQLFIETKELEEK